MTAAEAPDPIAAPLTYPGAAPDSPAVLVTDAGVLGVRPRAGALGAWRVELAPGNSKALDEVLGERGAALTGDRAPVLAVGSNAAPTQIRRKLSTAGLTASVPVTAVTVDGLSVGVSAHVSKAGYVPATPVPDPLATSQPMWVTWLAPEELEAMDKTEPNYDRVQVPGSCAVRLTPVQALSQCWLYVSRHGYLTERSGEPRKLVGQGDLISRLLAELPALTDLAGNSPEEWVSRARDQGVRDGIRDLFRASGITRSPDRGVWALGVEDLGVGAALLAQDRADLRDRLGSARPQPEQDPDADGQPHQRQPRGPGEDAGRGRVHRPV